MISLLLAAALISGNRQSQADLEARVRANNSDAAAHYQLCRTYYGLENWDGAIDQCEQAVHINPSSNYHDWLGRAYGAKAEHSSWVQAVSLAKKVRTEFEQAVQADSNNPIAHRDLAEFYIEAPGFLGGGKDKAQAQAATLDSISKADAFYIRGRLAETAKDKEQAESLYKQAVDSSKNPAEALSELAGFYRRTGNLDQMQATINRIAASPDRNPGTPFFDGAAMLVRTGRNLPQAVSMLKRFIAAGGTDESPLHQAYYQLGLAYEKQGDKVAAANQFKQSSEIANYAPAEKALTKTK
jgi:tetratricopeptide (TPR) repeat protein